MSEALQRLREARNALVRPGAPATVNLRDYVPEGSEAWQAFVREWPAEARSGPPEGPAAWRAFVRAWRVPGHGVPRATLIGWIEDVIARLEAAPAAPEKPVAEPVGEPAREVEAPSPREVVRAGERSSPMEGAVFSLETDDIARAMAERAVADGEAGPATDWPVAATVPARGMDDWYYGPEDDEEARAERASLTAAQWEERLRWQAEHGGTVPAPASDGPERSAGAPPRGTPLRRLTAEGIAEARAFLTRLREEPDAEREPSRELLYRQPYSRPYSEEVRVERRGFRNRREAGAYLSPLLAPVRHRITDDAGVWSWLGMFYFPEIAGALEGRSRDIALEAFVFSDDESTTEKRRSYQRRYRHLLRGSWLLWERHREDAAFLLDEDITTFTDLADRVFSDFRVFNSAGVVPLAIRLYAEGEQLKERYSRSPGGLRHLLRVLPQLELTYDVYGMAPDALLDVLPDDFRAWERASA